MYHAHIAPVNKIKSQCSIFVTGISIIRQMKMVGTNFKIVISTSFNFGLIILLSVLSGIFCSIFS